MGRDAETVYRDRAGRAVSRAAYEEERRAARKDKVIVTTVFFVTCYCYLFMTLLCLLLPPARVPT